LKAVSIDKTVWQTRLAVKYGWKKKGPRQARPSIIKTCRLNGRSALARVGQRTFHQAIRLGLARNPRSLDLATRNGRQVQMTQSFTLQQKLPLEVALYF
jgi:hypothetical protein